MDVDLDQARRRAKELLRAARAGDRQARSSLHPNRIPQLADAQHAVAREVGFASWPALVRHVEATRNPLGGDPGPTGRDDDVEHLARGDALQAQERVLEPGPVYVPGSPVRVRLRIRGRRHDLDDFGSAVRAAGAPAGWLETAERVVEAAGLNVNRRGVVFLPVVAGGDLEALARKVADTSLVLFQELLERQE